MKQAELRPSSPSLKEQIDSIRRPWVGSEYYEDAEKWTFLFWDAQRDFRPLFNQLPRGKVLELACGHGRHAEQAAPLVEELILVDVIHENLDICRTRLARFRNVEYRLGAGDSFPDCEAASLDAIYCYDAMVHFSPDIIDGYLRETSRVLRPGGRALFHHSNFGVEGGRSWSQNPCARNYMTVERFAQRSEAAGLHVVAQKVVRWGGYPDLDGISLVERTAEISSELFPAESPKRGSA